MSSGCRETETLADQRGSIPRGVEGCSIQEKGFVAKAMTKSQIAEHLAKKPDIKKVQAMTILDEIANLAYKEAKNSFTLPGLGKIVLVQRKANDSRALRGISSGMPLRRRRGIATDELCKTALSLDNFSQKKHASPRLKSVRSVHVVNENS
jgi:nucleoid DNA-binding protein